jgi:putative colanic acid biosynthesis acetyltransferase WcaF
MGVHPYPSARIWAPWNLKLGPYSCIGPRVICYSVGLIELGSHAIISQGVHLCAASHDHRDPEFPLVVGSIRIADHAWVAADAFVGPGVIIMDRAVVGARAVVTKHVAPGTVVVGNPARAVGIRQSINQPRMQHG